MLRRAAVLLLLAAPVAGAQEAPGNALPLELGHTAPVTTLEVPSPIVTVDMDRLFAESAWGLRVQAEVQRRGQELSAENRRIEEELVSEEQALTALRPELEPADFRLRAAAFDEKVQKLRAEQDAKLSDLNSFQNSERQRFSAEVGDSLGQIVLNRGAVAIIDQRVVVLSIAAIDITDEAIAQVDADLGDGTPP